MLFDFLYHCKGYKSRKVRLVYVVFILALFDQVSAYYMGIVCLVKTLWLSGGRSQIQVTSNSHNLQ